MAMMLEYVYFDLEIFGGEGKNSLAALIKTIVRELDPLSW